MLWYKHDQGVVEHKGSLRGTQGVAECFSDFSSALELPECLLCVAIFWPTHGLYLRYLY
jgi:hypothetical protein